LFATETSLIDLLPHQLAAVLPIGFAFLSIYLARDDARQRLDQYDLDFAQYDFMRLGTSLAVAS